jgi:hypothetical protein
MKLTDNMRVKVSHESGVEYGVIESALDASKAILFAMKITVKMDDGTYCGFPARWIEVA